MWKEREIEISLGRLVREWHNDNESEEISGFTIIELLGDKIDVSFLIHFRSEDAAYNGFLANMFSKETGLGVLKMSRNSYSGNFSGGQGDVVKKFLDRIHKYSPMFEKMKTQIHKEIYSADKLFKDELLKFESGNLNLNDLKKYKSIDLKM